MTRFFAFICLSALTACTPQELPDTFYSVWVYNNCGYPVHVMAHDYDDYGSSEQDLEEQLDAGKVIGVLIGRGSGDDPASGVHTTYRLEISANGKKRSFNKAQLLRLMGEAKNVDKDKKSRTWRINDPSICP